MTGRRLRARRRRRAGALPFGGGLRRPAAHLPHRRLPRAPRPSMRKAHARRSVPLLPCLCTLLPDGAFDVAHAGKGAQRPATSAIAGHGRHARASCRAPTPPAPPGFIVARTPRSTPRVSMLWPAPYRKSGDRRNCCAMSPKKDQSSAERHRIPAASIKEAGAAGSCATEGREGRRSNAAMASGTARRKGRSHCPFSSAAVVPATTSTVMAAPPRSTGA